MAVTWAPTVADVAALLRARTKDKNGKEQGTFTSELVDELHRTRPSAEAVLSLIDRATATVNAALGGEIPPAVEGAAEDLAALRAAMAIELSYFPEQVPSGQSPYAELKALYDEGIAAAQPRVTEETGEDPTGERAYGMPTYSFPVICNPIGQVRW